MKYLSETKFKYARDTPAYSICFKSGTYHFACENNGKCKAIEFKELTGEEYVNIGIEHTHRKAVRDSGDSLEYVDVLVCTKCYRPVNSTAARELNEWLGNIIGLEDLDLDFLENF